MDAKINGKNNIIPSQGIINRFGKNSKLAIAHRNKAGVRHVLTREYPLHTTEEAAHKRTAMTRAHPCTELYKSRE